MVQLCTVCFVFIACVVIYLRWSGICNGRAMALVEYLTPVGCYSCKMYLLLAAFSIDNDVCFVRIWNIQITYN